MTMQSTSAMFIIFQGALLIVSILIAIGSILMASQFGAGLCVPPFQSVQRRRIAAALSPFIILPVCIFISIKLHKQGMYDTALWLPSTLIMLVVSVSRLYLRAVPDPIIENWGPRPFPYPGFLVFPAEAAPKGFKEVRHHYSKWEYVIDFEKIDGDRRTRLRISEHIEPLYYQGDKKPAREFTHKGISGCVYEFLFEQPLEKRLTLFWVNPPMQQVCISLSQQLDEFGPDDIIELFMKMKDT
jgi:hypothetical protein